MYACVCVCVCGCVGGSRCGCVCSTLSQLAFNLPTSVEDLLSSHVREGRALSHIMPRPAASIPSWVAWNGHKAAVLMRTLPTCTAAGVSVDHTWVQRHSTALVPDQLVSADSGADAGVHSAFYVQRNRAVLDAGKGLGRVGVRLSLQRRLVSPSPDRSSTRSKRVTWLPTTGALGHMTPVGVSIVVLQTGAAWALVRYNYVAMLGMSGPSVLLCFRHV